MKTWKCATAALVTVVASALIATTPTSAGTAQASSPPPWMDTSKPPAPRADLLIAAMTLDQKIEQIANEPVYNADLDDGDPDNKEVCDFTEVGRHIEGIPELAIPDFRMANGGTGIRGGDCTPEPTATALPAQVASA